MAKPVITAFDWVPWFAKGQVRDLRVRWALEEVGQEYDVRYLPQGSQKQPPHRHLQPFGQVPTYEQDGLSLFESGAIVLHVGETYGGLFPDDAGGRARAIEWMFAALNTVEPPITDYTIATSFEAHEPWSKARLPAIVARISERLDELSRRLGESEWLDGDFSGGDLLMIAVLRQLKGTPMETAHDNLTAYVARGEARPAFQRALAAQLAGFTAAPPPEYVFLDREPGEEGESR